MLYKYILTGFDSHLLLRELEYYDKCTVIPINKESVLGIKLCDYSPEKGRPRISIMDSNSFLSGSLDKLSKRLVDDGHNMDLLKTSKLCRDDEGEFVQEKYNLLTRKGNYILYILLLLTKHYQEYFRTNI